MGDGLASGAFCWLNRFLSVGGRPFWANRAEAKTLFCFHCLLTTAPVMCSGGDLGVQGEEGVLHVDG